MEPICGGILNQAKTVSSCSQEDPAHREPFFLYFCVDETRAEWYLWRINSLGVAHVFLFRSWRMAK